MSNPTWKQDILNRWNLFIYPARPDHKEIEQYGHGLDMLQVSKPAVLILGSTPVLRDLFLN